MPHVKPGESEKDYVSRCIPYEMHKHPDMDNKQAAAICYSLYRKHEDQEMLINKIDIYLDESPQTKSALQQHFDDIKMRLSCKDPGDPECKHMRRELRDIKKC